MTKAINTMGKKEHTKEKKAPTHKDRKEMRDSERVGE